MNVPSGTGEVVALCLTPRDKLSSLDGHALYPSPFGLLYGMKEAATMALDEKTRLDLRNKFEELIGPRLADATMEAMPPHEYDQLATKTDVTNLGIELPGEMTELRSELRGEIGGCAAKWLSYEVSFTGLRAACEVSWRELRAACEVRWPDRSRP